jgi:hypothetical protein
MRHGQFPIWILLALLAGSCAGSPTVKPAASARPTARQATATPAVASTLVPAIATPRALTIAEIPTDVRIELPGIVSNNGGGVLANNGASYRLADTGAPPLAGPAIYLRRVVQQYTVVTLLINLALDQLGRLSPAQQVDLLAGKRVLTTVLGGLMASELSNEPGRDPELRVFKGDGDQALIMRMTFQDKDHAHVVFRVYPDQLPAAKNFYAFVSTFDRVENTMESDIFCEDHFSGGDGKWRLYLRQSAAVVPGAQWHLEATSTGHRLTEPGVTDGVTAATLNVTRDGQGAAIWGTQVPGAPAFSLKTNAAVASAPHGFFLNADGSEVTRPTDALVAILPTDDQIVRPYEGGFYPSPADVDHAKDASFDPNR